MNTCKLHKDFLIIKYTSEGYIYDKIGRLKDITTEICTDETVVEDVTLPNGKTKTVERKQRVCETAVTQTEKQKNTLSYTSNNLNQYTKLDNLNKAGEVKKEFTYKYDNNGNLIRDDINQYFYDYKNRLVKVVQNEVVKVDENGNITETIPEKEIVSYSYDILGRRISKTTPEKTTQYTYAGQNAIEERTSNNATNTLLETRENVYSNNLDDILSTIITDYTTETQTTKRYFYQKNHLGSIIKITDEQGSIIEQYEYDVFGIAYVNVNNLAATSSNSEQSTLSILNVEGSETDMGGNSEEVTIDNVRYKRYNGKGKIGNTRLYTGREYDAELKLYYNRARYYSPDLGRFISRDPIDITDDVNLYSYVGNNGVMFVDPFGRAKDAMLDIFTNAISVFNELENLGFADKYKKWYSQNTGEYDLTYHIKKKVTEERTVLQVWEDNHHVELANSENDPDIMIGGNIYKLGQVSNILVGFNAYNAGYSEETLRAGGLSFTMLCEIMDESCSNGYEGEYTDRWLYNAGYNLAEQVENNNGVLTESMLLDAIKIGTTNKNYKDSNLNFNDKNTIFGVKTISNILEIPMSIGDLIAK